MIGDKTDGEKKEDEKGLPGSSTVAQSIGQVWFLLGWLACDHSIGHHQRDEYKPKDNQQKDVDVRFPLCLME